MTKETVFYVVTADPSELYKAYGRIRAYGTLSAAKKEATRINNSYGVPTGCLRKVYKVTEVHEVE